MWWCELWNHCTKTRTQVQCSHSTTYSINGNNVQQIANLLIDVADCSTNKPLIETASHRERVQNRSARWLFDIEGMASIGLNIYFSRNSQSSEIDYILEVLDSEILRTMRSIGQCPRNFRLWNIANLIRMGSKTQPKVQNIRFWDIASYETNGGSTATPCGWITNWINLFCSIIWWSGFRGMKNSNKFVNKSESCVLYKQREAYPIAAEYSCLREKHCICSNSAHSYIWHSFSTSLWEALLIDYD